MSQVNGVVIIALSIVLILVAAWCAVKVPTAADVDAYLYAAGATTAVLLATQMLFVVINRSGRP